jgi:hypothetical protein
VGGQFPEAPHLYEIGDYWYLVIAEGGTERGHAVSVARASAPTGPFETGPSNPILTARGTSRPIQNTGHGDLVLGPGDQWLLVCLGVRPRSMTRAFSALGRETFVTTVEWHDGWPTIEPVQLTPREGVVTYRDDFDTEQLAPQWMSVRRTPESTSELRGGALVVRADGSTLSDLIPAFVGRRQEHQTARARVSVDVSAGVGGLAVRYSERFHYSLCAGDGRILARAVIPAFDQQWELPFSGTTVELELNTVAPDPGDFGMATSDLVELVAIVDGVRTVLAAPDGRYLSSEGAESFTGRVIGVFATEGEIAVDWFDYDGSDA